MPTENPSQQIVVFSLAGEHYALPIQQVQEIIRYTDPRSVASSVDWIRGVISLRGRIVPVYDVAARLGTSTEVGEQTKIVIVDIGTETAGVIVDSVDEVLTVSSEDMKAAPNADSSLIQAIVRVDERLIALLTLGSAFQVTAPELSLAA
jgi:purine-binding chemotaxis protein CheW